MVIKDHCSRINQNLMVFRGHSWLSTTREYYIMHYIKSITHDVAQGSIEDSEDKIRVSSIFIGEAG